MRCTLITSLVLFALLRTPASEAQVVATLKGHKHTITCLAFSNDGKVLASGSKDGSVLLWDVAGRNPGHAAWP